LSGFGQSWNVSGEVSDEESTQAVTVTNDLTGMIKRDYPGTLIILDGWGIREEREGNAVKLARTPTMDGLYHRYRHTALLASGKDVGLPAGVMGNSEVGHLNIGAGRKVMQALSFIDEWVEDGSFYENSVLIEAVDAIAGTDRSLHLMGLVSDGGVHSWPSHYYALLELARRRGLAPNQVKFHAITDGRDTPPTGGVGYVKELVGKMREIEIGRIATVCGRYWAMDRDKRWDRVEKAYNCYTLGEGMTAIDPIAAIEQAYARGETDEFIKATAIVDGVGHPVGLVEDGDSMIFFNFRGDRPREITRAFVDEKFTGFERKRRVTVKYTCLTRYDATIPVPVAFPPEQFEQRMDRIFGEIISQAGLAQLRIAETEKYAHVTFFFNGQEEKPFPGEERILIPSSKVATYDLKPEMSAFEVASTLIGEIQAQKFDVIICNFANPDMVGHSGILEAAIRAVETVDACLGQVLDALNRVGGVALVLADHGNAEMMIDPNTGEPHTAHTTNPVPCILVDDTFRGTLRSGGRLADVAPTLLELLRLPQPVEMTGQSLLQK
jgi:2,3-bisphosphoglycerate-independent phosphoglycerate mutase